MALTRPRYSQIPDSDYKNSCRIVTTTNVTLTSGAPSTYDGVTLVQYDRVLVAGQTDKTQNGIYSVSTLGSGSNGTWVRSKDANANDRLTAGMNTFIEEGTYTGQFWHLLTPGPIVLGVTELIFGQISGNAAGISSQVQYNSAGSIAGAANLRYDSATGNVLIGGGTVSTSNVTGALVLTGQGGAGIGGNVNVGGNVTADKFYTTNGLFWAANGLAFSSGLEVSEINTANVLSNISTQVTALRFDRDTGIYVNELSPGNVRVSLGSTFKTWHVPGQSDLVAVAEDEVTFFGNGIDITTNPVYPKSITFISNTSILEANIGAFYNYANANIGSIYNHVSTLDENFGAFQVYANANIGVLYLGNISTQANLGSFQTYSNSAIASIVNNANTNIAAYLTTTTSSNIVAANVNTGNIFANSITIAGNITINGNVFTGNVYTGNIISSNVYTGNVTSTGNVTVDGNLIVQSVDILANIGLFYSYANANIGTLFLGNATTNANLGAYQTWANNQISGAFSEISALGVSTSANAAYQADSITAIAANLNTIAANLGAFESYANTKIGTNSNSNLVIASTDDSVSAITGALVVAGGAGIGGNLYVAGNIFASNLISIGTTTLTVTDPLLYLSVDNPSPYNYDIGFFSHFVGGTPSHYQHTGIARNYTNNVWGFFSNIRTEPGATIDWANVDIIYDTVRVGDLIASNTTAATSTTTGALRVAGGAGIAGELYIANTGDVSANIGNLYLGNVELNANLGAYQTWANAEISTININASAFQEIVNANLGVSTSFAVTNSGTSHYLINNETNPELYLIRGLTYKFVVNAAGQPFWIKTFQSIGVGDQYSDGVTNNGADSGTVTFQVPLSAPDTLYYISQYESALTGQFNVIDFSELYSNIGTLYLGNVTTQANLGAFQTYVNTSVATLDSNIGTLFLGNASTQANLGAYQTYANANIGLTSVNFAAFASYANTKIGTNNNGNLVIDATTTSVDSTTGALVVKGGIGVAGNVYSDKVYTTQGIYWAGNGAVYAAGSGSGSGITYTASATAPGSPSIGDQWYDTTDGTLYEYIDDGDSTQWVDIASPTISSTDPIAFGTDVGFASNITVDGNIYIGDGIFWTVNGAPYSTGGGGGGGTDDVLRANVGAYQIYANANIGTLYLGNISTNANLGAYQTWANARIDTLDANIGTLFLGNASIQANLGAYQTWANTTFASGSYSNTNAAAYLTQGANIGSGSTTGNLVAAATTTSTSTTTGALVVRGGVGIAGTTYVGGDVRVTSGTASVSKVTGAILVTGGIGVSGDVNMNAGSTTAGWTVGGLLQATSSTPSTSTSTGALYVAGGAGIVGNLFVGGNVVLGSSTSSNLVANATTTSTSTTTGALVVKGGLGVAGNVYANGNLILGSGTSSNLVANATTTSSSTTTGALVVKGGVGIAGAAYIGGVARVTASTGSTNTTSGALVVTGGVGVGGAVYVGGTLNVTGSITATSSITINSNGLNVTAGGMSITGDSVVAGGYLQVTSGIASSSTSTGALTVQNNGGLGVTGSIYGNKLYTVDGIFWAGNTAIYSAPLPTVIDANIGALYLGNVTTNANLGAFQTYANSKIGTNTNSNLVVVATTTSTSTTTGALVVGGGIGVAGNVYTDKVYTTQGLYWAGNNLPFTAETAPSFTSNLMAASGTASTNTTTGALVVTGSGGAGIGGALNVGGDVRLTSSTASASTTSGALRVDGGVGVVGDLNATAGSTVNGWTVGGLLWAALETPATSATSGGGLLVGGGARFLGNVYASGNIFLGANTSSNLVANATTTSTSTTTGALVVRGGMGIVGNIMSGGNIISSGNITGSYGFYTANLTIGTSSIQQDVLDLNNNNLYNVNTIRIYDPGTSEGIAWEGGSGWNIYESPNDLSNNTGNLQIVLSGARALTVDTNQTVDIPSTWPTTSTTTGALTVGGGVGVGGNLYVGNEFVVPGGGKVTSSGLANFLEKANVVASAPATIINIDLSSASVMYWTSNSTVDMTANIRGNATTPLNSLLAVGQSITTALFIPNAATNFLINTVKIDNTTVTPAYQGSSAPTLGNANSIDIYSFTILKTADATYKVFATQTQFMHPG